MGKKEFVLSGYNDGQKRILEAFESQIEPDVSYLFYLPSGAETGGVAGYNPPGYNFGFIYDGANARTVAHELGHGIGSLRHPFDNAANAVLSAGAARTQWDRHNVVNFF